MIIREMTKEDIPACADIMCSVYNNEMWMCRWEKDTAIAYLLDYYNTRKFVGYIIIDNDTDDSIDNHTVIGALFAHEKIWWNNSEVFIEEMFISPDRQRSGLGTMLLNKVETYVKENHLAGITLSTNKYAPAPLFYKKNGFTECEHVMFMAKEM